MSDWMIFLAGALAAVATSNDCHWLVRAMSLWALVVITAKAF